MNQLPIEKRTQIIDLLVEGSSILAASSVTGVSINTVSKLLMDVGRSCIFFHNETVKDLPAKHVQYDEIWTFVYSKDKKIAGDREDEAVDICTWTGIDEDSKLIISWMVGDRSVDSVYTFITDVESRLQSREELTKVGYKLNLSAFKGEVDFALLLKIDNKVESGNVNERKCNNLKNTSSKKMPIISNPDQRHISISHTERQNLTMRRHVLNFTGLTDRCSKKIENYNYTIALHFVYYNFCKIHKTLGITPAMEAGLTTDIMKISDILKLTDKYQAY